MITTLATAAPRVPAVAPRPRTGPALVAATLFVLHCAFALRNHARFRTTGYDLGIFGQAVRSYAEGRLPASEIRTATAPAGFEGEALPLLGDHFHPVLALLGPVYRLVPHVEVLLVAQAALVSAAVYVTGRTAQRHLPGRPYAGVVIGAACGLAWGVQTLVGFDFHEVAFALPPLALACRAYLDGRLRAAVWWAAGLLLVKEDLGATAAVLGLLVAHRARDRRDRRAGLLLAGGSVLAALLVLKVVVPGFAPDGRYLYAEGVGGAYGILDGWSVKVLTVLALPAVTGGLVVRSPLAWLLVPTLGWRFVSSVPSHWEPGLHYSAVLVPVAFAALVDALRRGARLPLAVPLGVVLLLLPLQPTAQLATPGFWREGEREAAARAAVGLVPDGVRVAASNTLAPHLTDRTVVRLAVPGLLDRAPVVEWLVLDRADGFPAGATEGVLREAAGEPSWRVVREEAGIVLLRRER
ncbi:DUF2079 domain-containing protein [Streptomyces sp. R302]|uniref:DUF2079 domain-containing protein n=1 Tax=unclassified Streptomyces TaxID=2593676 RepID=UPI00145F6001|nr:MULTISPECIES: DUF2079 domain-containing protein [unclassified Streptomyces]NML54882.1 DUF2079 domain-containing protein [Streptomyces sp. R301]NML83569.1 DUF2079 domain-containing protein [Streptomyces sp. R302]